MRQNPFWHIFKLFCHKCVPFFYGFIVILCRSLSKNRKRSDKQQKRKQITAKKTETETHTVNTGKKSGTIANSRKRYDNGIPLRLPF